MGTDSAIHMLAGAVAGVMEHVSMFPIDTVKTRMMAKTEHVDRFKDLKKMNNVRGELMSIIRNEGYNIMYICCIIWDVDNDIPFIYKGSCDFGEAWLSLRQAQCQDTHCILQLMNTPKNSLAG